MNTTSTSLAVKIHKSTTLISSGEIISDARNTHSLIIKYATQVKTILKNSASSELINLNDNLPLKEFPAVERAIRAALLNAIGGVFILGAPPGCGKTTYLKKCINEVRKDPANKDKIIAIFNGLSILIDRKLHEHLGIRKEEMLSDYLPPGTVIVIDQADNHIEALTIAIRDYIVDLATNSWNSRGYTVIICVSDPVVMRTLLELNGQEKIRDLCDPEYFRWTVMQRDDYIRKAFVQFNESERQKLADVCRSCSVGLLYRVYNKMKSNDFSAEKLLLWAKQNNEVKEKDWEKYTEEFRQGFVFDRPFEREEDA